MTSFSYRTKPLPGDEHTTVQIYAGPDEQHRAFCGALTLRTQEAQDFVHRLERAGVLPTTSR